MREIPYVNLKGGHRVLRKEILQALEKVLEEGQFILGKEVQEFEESAAQYCGVGYAVGLNSGTDALFLALKVLGLGKGDEIITPPNSFLGTASAIVAAGARPVFVDIGEDLNIDPSRIEEAVTPRTKAILPVHLTGRPAKMPPIWEIAQKHGLKIIEDAAQAIGAEWEGEKTGSLGDVGCFSLHPLKTLNACGDAGLITTDDEKVYHRLLALRNIGLKNRDESEEWGFNSRLDTVQAAILSVKLKYLDAWTQRRRENASFYREALADVVEVPPEEGKARHAYHTFVIQTDRRDALQKHLALQGIGSKIHYPIPIHLQVAAKGLGYKKGDFPVCERACGRILSLPIYQELTPKDLQYVVEQIRDFFKK